MYFNAKARKELERKIKIAIGRINGSECNIHTTKK